MIFILSKYAAGTFDNVKHLAKCIKICMSYCRYCPRHALQFLDTLSQSTKVFSLTVPLSE